MANFLQNLFQVHQRLLRRWDILSYFLFLAPTTIRIRLKVFNAERRVDLNYL